MSTTYGDISPRTAAYVAAKMLERALPSMCLSRFGQQQPIPKNKTNAIKWRRYNSFAPSTVPLVEGVTPAPDLLTHTDVTATLGQYGRRLQVSDAVVDTHEDPVLMESAEVMGELAAQTSELVIFNSIKGGTNVQYVSSNAARTGVNGPIVAAELNKALRTLNRQNAKMVTKALKGTDAVGTAPIRPAYIAVCHPDLQFALEGITGWKNPVEYSNGTPMMPNEIGAFKNVRFFTSTLFQPWLAAATTTGSGSTYMTNGSTGTGIPDVYPIIIFGADAFATVSLAGSTALQPIVVNPKPSDSDPLAQRGHVGFKGWMTAAILNDAWMLRIECAVAQTIA
jgi:N4-gp56 family major capsid protein